MADELHPYTDDDLRGLVANYPDLAKSFGVGVARERARPTYGAC
jgi:hypothetical protein